MQRKDPHTLYLQHRKRAKNRTDKLGNPIQFLLTFEQWWQVWQDSGKWEQRGIGRDAFCMARNNDVGNYEVGNVTIKTQAANMSEAKKGSDPWNKGQVCPQLSAAQMGREPWNKGVALVMTRHKALRFE